MITIHFIFDNMYERIEEKRNYDNETSECPIMQSQWTYASPKSENKLRESD